MSDIQCEYCYKFYTRKDILTRHLKNCKAKQDYELKQEFEEQKTKLETMAKKENIGTEKLLQQYSTKMKQIIESTNDSNEIVSKMQNISEELGSKCDFLNTYSNDDKKAYLDEIDINIPRVKTYLSTRPNHIQAVLQDINEIWNANPNEIRNRSKFIREHQIFDSLVDIVCFVLRENGLFRQLCWGNKKELLTKLKIGQSIGWFVNKNLDTFNHTFWVLLKKIKETFETYIASVNENNQFYEPIVNYLNIPQENKLETNNVYREIFISLLISKLQLTFDILAELMTHSLARNTNVINNGQQMIADNINITNSDTNNNNNINITINLKAK